MQKIQQQGFEVNSKHIMKDILPFLNEAIENCYFIRQGIPRCGTGIYGYLVQVYMVVWLPDNRKLHPMYSIIRKQYKI